MEDGYVDMNYFSVDEMIKRHYSDGMCKDCHNNVCKVYGGRCRKYRINREWNMVKSFVKKWFPYALLYIIVALIITYGWQGLELIFYGEAQHRVVDDIIGYILILSICINAIFCKAIFIPKSEMQKYVVLKREDYNNQKLEFRNELVKRLNNNANRYTGGTCNGHEYPEAELFEVDEIYEIINRVLEGIPEDDGSVD